MIMSQEEIIEILEKIALSDQLDIVAMITSVLAIIISFAGIVIQKRLNSSNLQSKYFEEIFKDYFLVKIPKCAKSLSFNSNGKLNASYKELNNVFMEMVRKSAYFAYAKNDFYEELRKRTIQLDEKLVVKAGETEQDEFKQKEFIFSVHQDIMKIVKLVNKNYHSF